jgi:death on curing protein
MRYLTRQEICYLNRKNITRFGGNFIPSLNILNNNSLNYLVEIVSAEISGEPLYPSISHKAALYCYSIICNHVFSDGNKRTGLDSCLLFLELNGHALSDKITNEVLTNFILEVASGNHTLQSVQDWLKENSVQK